MHKALSPHLSEPYLVNPKLPFSVIIPVFNHVQYLRQAVDSALATGNVTEVLLIDDGSEDESAKLCLELSHIHRRVRLLASTGNRGTAYRLNELIQSAQEEWIAVLNSDDRFSPGRFDLIADEITRNQHAQFITGGVRLIDESDQSLEICIGKPRYLSRENAPFIGILDPTNTSDLVVALSFFNVLFTTSNMIFRRTLHENLGGFRSFSFVHDWDFALRACLCERTIFIPGPLTEYRIHPLNTIKQSHLETCAETQQFFEELIAEQPDYLQRPRIRESLRRNAYVKPSLFKTQPAPQPQVAHGGSPDNVRYVVVHGMHRSGTSVTAKLLAGMGLNTGPEADLLPANLWNPSGYYESKQLVHCNDRLLASLGCSWHNVAAFNRSQVPKQATRIAVDRWNQILASAPANQILLLKDPRLCLTYPLLTQQAPVAHIFVFRHPIDVAISLDARDGLSNMLSMALWERYVISAMSFLTPETTILVNYDALIERPSEEIENLASKLRDMGVTVDVPTASLANVVQTALRHANHEERHLRSVFVQPWQTDIYQQLLSGELVKQEALAVSLVSEEILKCHREFCAVRRKTVETQRIVKQIESLEDNLSKRLDALVHTQDE